MTLFEKICRMVGDRRIPAPRMPAFRLFRVGFANRHVTTIVVMAIMVSAGAVSVGLYFAVKDVANASWNWPDSGAAYYAGEDGLGTMGQQLPLNQDGTESQTLEVRMAANSRMDTLTATLEMGKASVDCIAIERVSGTSGYLWVDTFTLDNLVAPTLSLNASYIHQMTLSGFVDGHHVGPTQNSAGAPDITVESTRGAGTYTATGTVDRLLITLAGDAYIRLVTITGHCSTGPVDLDFIKAGQFTLSDAHIGDDGNINTIAVDIASDTVVHSLTDSLIDRSIVVK
jgi:hypothetical protein